MSVAAKLCWALAALGLAAVIVGSPALKLAGGVLVIGAIAYLSRGRGSANTSGDPGIPDGGSHGGGDGGGHGGSDGG